MSEESPNSGRLNNPFSNDKDGFLSFSASTPLRGGASRGNLNSTPTQSGGDRGHFNPRRGKPNRLNNWERFGDYMGEGPNYPSQRGRGQQNNSPFRGGNRFQNQGGNYSPQSHGGNFRGGHQWKEPYQSSPNYSSNNSPGFFRGSGGQGNYRGNFGGHTPRGNRGGHNHGSNQSYFHPSMVEDPWADLLANRRLETSSSSRNNSNLSDSRRAVAGQSILERSTVNPAPDVSDIADYSSGGEDEGTVHSTKGNQELSGTSFGLNNTSNSDFSSKSVSDSMIPLVGDSFLVNEVTDATN